MCMEGGERLEVSSKVEAGITLSNVCVKYAFHSDVCLAAKYVDLPPKTGQLLGTPSSFK